MTKARDLANAGTALTSVSSTELGYLDGVTSAVQTQINAKASYPTQTGNSGKYLTTDGSATSWETVPEPGLKLIEAKTISSVASVSFDNAFTSTYQNYRIVVSLNKSIATGFVYMRMRASSADNTASSYFSRAPFNQIDGTGFGEQLTNAGTGFTFNDAADLHISLDVYKPQESSKTFISGGTNLFTYSTAVYAGGFSGLFNNTTQFDGFTIYPTSGNITGTVRVYAYKN